MDSPSIPEDPGLYADEPKLSVPRIVVRYSPALQPYDPRLCVGFVCWGSKSAIGTLTFEGPEKERIIRMSRAVHRDVPREAAR